MAYFFESKSTIWEGFDCVFKVILLSPTRTFTVAVEPVPEIDVNITSVLPNVSQSPISKVSEEPPTLIFAFSLVASVKDNVAFPETNSIPGVELPSIVTKFTSTKTWLSIHPENEFSIAAQTPIGRPFNVSFFPSYISSVSNCKSSGFGQVYCAANVKGRTKRIKNSNITFFFIFLYGKLILNMLRNLNLRGENGYRI